MGASRHGRFGEIVSLADLYVQVEDRLCVTLAVRLPKGSMDLGGLCGNQAGKKNTSLKSKQLALVQWLCQ